MKLRIKWNVIYYNNKLVRCNYCRSIIKQIKYNAYRYCHLCRTICDKRIYNLKNVEVYLING
jgi:hypothetical protein